MVVVSDTSVISGLLIIERLSLLEQLFTRVMIPTAVYQELLALEKYGYRTGELMVDWIAVESVEPNAVLHQQLQALDAGEIEAIILAKQYQADWLLIDEKKGRLKAEELGLKIIGLLGILVKAKQEGYLSKVKSELDKLGSQAEFRMSQSLIELVLRTVDEL